MKFSFFIQEQKLKAYFAIKLRNTVGIEILNLQKSGINQGKVVKISEKKDNCKEEGFNHKRVTT